MRKCIDGCESNVNWDRSIMPQNCSGIFLEGGTPASLILLTTPLNILEEKAREKINRQPNVCCATVVVVAVSKRPLLSSF